MALLHRWKISIQNIFIGLIFIRNSITNYIRTSKKKNIWGMLFPIGTWLLLHCMTTLGLCLLKFNQLKYMSLTIFLHMKSQLNINFSKLVLHLKFKWNVNFWYTSERFSLYNLHIFPKFSPIFLMMLSFLILETLPWKSLRYKSLKCAWIIHWHDITWRKHSKLITELHQKALVVGQTWLKWRGCMKSFQNCSLHCHFSFQYLVMSTKKTLNSLQIIDIKSI